MAFIWSRETGDTSTVVEIPHGFTHIKNSTFIKDRLITEIIIPETVQCIEERAFAKCQNLKKVTVTDQLNRIEKLAFYQCFNLEEIAKTKTNHHPRSVTVEESAFERCYKLKSVDLELENVEEKAFIECRKLTHVTFTNHQWVSIGKNAFAYCGLETLVIPYHTKYLGHLCFLGCYNLKHIYFYPNANFDLEDPAILFEDCPNISFFYCDPSSVSNYRYIFSRWNEYKNITVLPLTTLNTYIKPTVKLPYNENQKFFIATFLWLLKDQANLPHLPAELTQMILSFLKRSEADYKYRPQYTESTKTIYEITE